jgi:hypothetical protein
MCTRCFTGPTSVFDSEIMAIECDFANFCFCGVFIAFVDITSLDRGLRILFMLGCWRNDFKPPVLKHGPRSLTSMRVFGCKTRTRNESERR